MQTEERVNQLPSLSHSAYTEDPSARPLGEDPFESVSLAAVAGTLRRHRRELTAVALTVVLAVTAIAFFLPNTYTARASFIPPSSTSGSLSSLANQLSAVGGGSILGGGVKSNADLYVGMLSSRTVAARLVERFHLMSAYEAKKESAAIKRLGKQSRFEAGVRDGIVTIEVTDRSPERARDLANGYLEELRYVTGQLALSEAAQRRLFFEQQLTREKDALADAEVAMKQLQEKTGLVSPAGQTQAELATITQTRAAIASRQVELAGLRYSSTDEDPEVVRVKHEIAELQSQLEVLQKGAGASNSVDIPSSKVPQVELDYVRQEREVKYHEALFQMMAKQYEAARLDESHDAPVLQVLDRAAVPDTKSGPPRLIIVAVGLLFGIILGILWVLLAHRDWMPRSL